MEDAPVAVVETQEFLQQAQKLMTDSERALLVDYLARNPEKGDLIKSGGGVRKLRWGLAGRGKSSGARVIYFFHNAGMPIYVFSVYAKNRRADVSDADRNDFKRIAKLLVETYERPEHE